MNTKAMDKLLSGALDGELTPGPRAQVEQWLANHPDAVAQQEQWARVGDLLREPLNPPDPELEWQAIRRTIRSQAPAADAVVAETPVFSWRMAWAAAMLGLVSLGLYLIAGFQLHQGTLMAHGQSGAPAEVEWAESGVPGATMMIFADQETGMTVIWMDVEQNGNNDSKELEGS
ncbi:MAG: hypothetical protein KDL31_08730 [Kiritimatiellae bacterium]|nr:hypothetical protein [Kiritimatiellia bacterium]